jgi:predicted TPR repeat methyltransferase
VDPKNTKALYRKGQALEACGQLAAARNAYYEAARINPTKEIISAYEAVKEKMETKKKQEKAKNKLYGAFLKDQHNDDQTNNSNK